MRLQLEQEYTLRQQVRRTSDQSQYYNSYLKRCGRR